MGTPNLHGSHPFVTAGTSFGLSPFSGLRAAASQASHKPNGKLPSGSHPCHRSRGGGAGKRRRAALSSLVGSASKTATRSLPGDARCRAPHIHHETCCLSSSVPGTQPGAPRRPSGFLDLDERILGAEGPADVRAEARHVEPHLVPRIVFVGEALEGGFIRNGPAGARQATKHLSVHSGLNVWVTQRPLLA